jgi:sulfatase maturation enzyme AslB (radical SAM superfamily)
MKNSQNVCSKIWTDVNINLCKPTIRHCCKQTSYKSSLDELKSLGPNFFEQYQLNIDNKKQMLFEGTLPDSCSFCKNANGNSIMNVWNFWSDDDVNQKRNTLLNERHTTYIELDIGNSCNMACVYCGPWSSTQWIKELGTKQKNTVINIEWKEEVFKNLKKWLLTFNLSEQLTFNILGGEPLMLSDTYSIVEELADMCRHFENKPVLMLTTNLNLKNSFLTRLLETVDKTKYVFEWIIAVSIEDVGERAEYVRYHLDWELFEKNINSIKNKVDSVYLTTTFTLFSLPEFKEFLDWSFKILGVENYSKTWRYSLNNVQDGFSDVAYLLSEQDNSQDIIAHYENILITNNIEWNRYSDEFVGHLKNMSSRIGLLEPTAEFFKYWTDMGNRRGLDYFKIPSLNYIRSQKGNTQQ